MSWRTVCITTRAKLEQNMGYLVVRAETTTRIHLSEINILIIDTPMVAITSSLMIELVKNRIKLILCDEKHNPTAELIDQYGSVDSSLRVREQISWTLENKRRVWTRIVSEKITKQRDLLQRYEHPAEANLLTQYLDELQPNDVTNREGHAAKVYFNALFGKTFSREVDNPENAALNYGYSLLLSCFNKEITCKGYLTQLGIFHENQFNPFNLSSDLMEPFRPLVDEKVISINRKEFGKDEKAMLLSLLSDEVLIQESKQKLTQAISIYTDRALDALQSGRHELLAFYQCIVS
jgi:CRISPR-associated endonuclease Cas1 subtype II